MCVLCLCSNSSHRHYMAQLGTVEGVILANSKNATSSDETWINSICAHYEPWVDKEY